MNYTKYNRIQKEINICKIKHDKKQMEYERFIDRKMFCTNKFKNTYSTEVYNCYINLVIQHLPLISLLLSIIVKNCSSKNFFRIYAYSKKISY